MEACDHYSCSQVRSKLHHVQLQAYFNLTSFLEEPGKAVHRMVYDYFQTHNILSVHQSGFRPLHSITTSLTDITNTVPQNIDKGKLTGLAFLDPTKAFDKLDHDLLLNKLTMV